MWCGRVSDGKGRAQKHMPSIRIRITMRINWALDILLPPKFQIEQTMKELQSILKWAILIIGGIGFIVFFGITFNKAYFNTSWEIDTKLAADFGSFVGGFVDTIFSLTGTLVVAYTFEKQFRQTNEMSEKQDKQNRKLEATNNFFKMIDSHNTMLGKMSIEDENGKVIQGGLVFDVMYRQFLGIRKSIVAPALKSVYDDLMCPLKYPFGLLEFCDDIAYAILYYGDDNLEESPRDKEWYYHALRNTKFEGNRKEEMLEKCAFILNECSRGNKKTCDFICRSNRPLLSVYFRGVYNTVDFIGNNKDLGDDKKTLIRIFQSHLLYTESLIWIYHIHAKIGESKWNKAPIQYIKEYGILDRSEFPFAYEE